MDRVRSCDVKGFTTLSARDILDYICAGPGSAAESVSLVNLHGYRPTVFRQSGVRSTPPNIPRTHNVRIMCRESFTCICLDSPTDEKFIRVLLLEPNGFVLAVSGKEFPRGGSTYATERYRKFSSNRNTPEYDEETQKTFFVRTIFLTF